MKTLIAEDDSTTRTILVGILKKWGYNVTAVSDGLSAWEVLQQPDPPRLVILDWIMPEMDGLEVIKQVRAHLVDQPPYIILLTSKDDKADIISGLDAGANDYVKKPFDNDELYARIRVGLRTLDLQTRLYETQQALAHLASHDPLTGALNRRAILEQLRKEIIRAQRSGMGEDCGGLRVAFVDIDRFKHINDHYGHQAGDEVLREVVDLISRHMRTYDLLGRLGGDELLLVMPGSGEGSSQPSFERFLAAVAGSRIMTSRGEITITVSIGVAAAYSGMEVDMLVERADAAMYQAKREGGNRIVYAD